MMGPFTPGELLVTLTTLSAVDRLGNPVGVDAFTPINYLHQVLSHNGFTWHVGEHIHDGQQLVVTFRPHQVTRPTQGPQAA